MRAEQTWRNLAGWQSMRRGLRVSGWRRAGVGLLHALGLLAVCAAATELLVLRGCGATRSCGPAQDAVTVLVTAGLLVGFGVIAALAWAGLLPGTRTSPAGLVPTLSKSSVTVVVLLTIASGGFYLPIWFQRRRDVLNALESDAKLWEWGPPALLVVQTIALLLPEATVGGIVAQLAVAVATFALAFRVRSILGDHAAATAQGRLLGGSVDSDGTPSALLTLLFTIWYLQYRINAMVDEARILAENAGLVMTAPVADES